MTTTSKPDTSQDFLDEDPARAMSHDQDILDALNRPPSKGWKPAPGETLSGTVVDLYDSSPGEYGEYPIMEVATNDGEIIAVHAFHTTLKSALERRKPKVGDRIGLRYEGRTTSGGFGDKGYESYRMIVLPPAGA